MPGVISENYLSRKFDLGARAGRELVYDVVGTEDEAEVLTLISGEAPALYQGLTQDGIGAEPLGGGVWKGYVRYASLDDDGEFTFSTGGGTTRVTQSRTTVASYAPPYSTAPDFQGAIGVTEDRVEGADIVAPAFEFSETHRLLDSAVDNAYKLALFNLTGRYNDATFRGFASGEVLFLGADGSKRTGDELWSITFRFSASPNVTGLVIGDISGIDKLGWDYLWVRYQDFEDADAFAIVKRPTAAYVERVYLAGDFSGLEIGTA